MPYSYSIYKTDVKEHFSKHIPSNTKILDVGPGAGTYSDLLRDLGYKIDCLEIFEPYIHQFDLNFKYENVIIGDITNFDFTLYDYIIMGDVLEHLTTEDAKIFIDKVNLTNKKCLVAVPYNYEQGEHFGNIYETHLQPDLTPINVLERYPSLKLIFGNELYGYYINYDLNTTNGSY
jgi:predicted TPR repeat methyltransferase